MRKFKFKGDPAAYKWDIFLEKDTVYAGTIQAFHRHSIQDLVDMPCSARDYFRNDWEEIKEEPKQTK